MVYFSYSKNNILKKNSLKLHFIDAEKRFGLCSCIVKQFALKESLTRAEECRNTEGMLVNNIKKGKIFIKSFCFKTKNCWRHGHHGNG